MRTKDHTIPKSRGGENHLFNYIPECMRCNSFRGNRTMMQQLEEYPEMFANGQRTIDTLIKYANAGKFPKEYFAAIKLKILKESSSALNLDLSALITEPRSKGRIVSKNFTIKRTKKFKINDNPDKKVTKKEIKKTKLKEKHAMKSLFKKEETKRR